MSIVHEILKALKIAHPNSISRWSGMFWLGVIMITRCALFGLCVRDSKAFKDSAPNSDLLESRVFCLCSSVMSRCSLRALRM